ncbi:MAG: hypothetical protein OXT65_03850 [Alphaproteobacteria bacterium]|nr:hypothetical protein [Alphaproteobacteria bacterium]
MSLQTAKKAKELLPDAVRRHARFIMEQAEHVRINHDAIAPYTQKLLDTYNVITTHDDNHLKTQDAERTAAYIIALDSLNFGSGYFRQARKDGAHFDYGVFSSGLKRGFQTGIFDTPEKWAVAKPQDFYTLYSISQGTSAAIDDLFSLFAKHLQETGQRIIDNYGGKSMNMVDAANGSAAKMAEMLAAWPTFHDYATYKGRNGPVLKRAQILPADLYLAGLGNFTDIDTLTIFADNRIPHVLRCDGVLSYTSVLADTIDRLKPLPSGSTEEIELRAASIHAVELMRDAVRDMGHHVNTMNIDHLLWNRGGEPALKSRPTHRTLTIWY